MKRKLITLTAVLAILITACNSGDQSKEEVKNNTAKTEVKQEKTIEKTSTTEVQKAEGDIKPEYLTTLEFKQKIWDYENNPEAWAYQSELPSVIDFYADWCKPCKMVAPIMDDLADYYDGRVNIYKVDTDKERELSSVFGIRSIPSILFIPVNGKPRMQAGAMSKEAYIEIIDDIVLGNKSNTNNKQGI